MSGAEGAKPVKIYVKNSSNKWVSWDGAITTGDIEIGAVEIKDHDGTDRLEITAANAAKVDPVAPTGINGAPVTVGTSAVEMTFTGTTKTINLKSASTNTGLIWFGPAGVTSAGANAYGELTADSAVEIGLNDASAAIYCISDTVSQTVYKGALT